MTHGKVALGPVFHHCLREWGVPDSLPACLPPPTCLLAIPALFFLRLRFCNIFKSSLQKTFCWQSRLSFLATTTTTTTFFSLFPFSFFLFLFFTSRVKLSKLLEILRLKMLSGVRWRKRKCHLSSFLSCYILVGSCRTGDVSF